MKIKNKEKTSTNQIFPKTPEEGKDLLESFFKRNRSLKISQNDVEKNTGIRQDHISKLKNGHFKYLDGQALKLCKYAFKEMTEHGNNDVKLCKKSEIERLSRSLSANTPELVEKVIDILKSFEDIMKKIKK